jgi:hypothetical protein
VGKKAKLFGPALELRNQAHYLQLIILTKSSPSMGIPLTVSPLSKTKGSDLPLTLIPYESRILQNKVKIVARVNDLIFGIGVGIEPILGRFD